MSSKDKSAANLVILDISGTGTSRAIIALGFVHRCVIFTLFCTNSGVCLSSESIPPAFCSFTSFSIAERMPSSYFDRLLAMAMNEDGQVLEKALRKGFAVLLTHRG